jgi:hypothetical protein
MALPIRELKYAMSVLSFPSSSHRIGTFITGIGRSVACIDCHVSFSFPFGAKYATIAKQFESLSCSIPISSNDDAPGFVRVVKIAST